MAELRKPLRWVASCLDDLRAFPDEVRREIGYALDFAQRGGRHPHAKPLKGFGGAGVLEITDDFRGETYRAIYTVKICESGLRTSCLSKEIEVGHGHAEARNRTGETAFENCGRGLCTPISR